MVVFWYFSIFNLYINGSGPGLGTGQVFAKTQTRLRPTSGFLKKKPILDPIIYWAG